MLSDNKIFITIYHYDSGDLLERPDRENRELDRHNIDCHIRSGCMDMFICKVPRMALRNSTYRFGCNYTSSTGTDQLADRNRGLVQRRVAQPFYIHISISRHRLVTIFRSGAG